MLPMPYGEYKQAYVYFYILTFGVTTPSAKHIQFTWKDFNQFFLYKRSKYC